MRVHDLRSARRLATCAVSALRDNIRLMPALGLLKTDLYHRFTIYRGTLRQVPDQKGL